MKLLVIIPLFFVLAGFLFSCEKRSSETSGAFRAEEVQSWKRQAARVTIIRDKWGIPHIYGKSDADAVFGMLYAQCEDDFKRVEQNYIVAMGRMAEVKGEESLYEDLRMRLYNDTTRAMELYGESPDWLKKLMDAYAAGINYYLHTHPETKPLLIRRFQPWMPLLFSEGSIGGDIETISSGGLRAFYGEGQEVAALSGTAEPEPKGSNGFAIAPANSATGNSLLLINPHTSFFFRSEQHVVSEEGLNAYGAVTWGQFFIYQGFNEHCGWMHTSSRADAIDEFLETVVQKEGGYYYKYGDEERPLRQERISLRYNTPDGPATREFTAFYTHRGPIIREENGRWVSIQLMQEPVKALTQSFMRTKAASFEAFNETMAIRTNSSNNTVYADDQGNIAYYHGNFIPKRDPRFDYSGPVDGSDPAVDWQGLHPLEETIRVINPPTGWLQNCNSTPFTAAAGHSPKPEDYPAYMAPDEENARGIHAVRVLQDKKDFTLESLIDAAYDPYLTGFERLVPAVVNAWRRHAGRYPELAAPVEALAQWDLRYSEESVPTALAVFLGQELTKLVYKRSDARPRQLALINYMEQQTSDEDKLQALSATLARLEAGFGSWQTPWGEINRFQRVDGSISEAFNDSLPSIPIAYTSSMWGALAAYGSRTYPGTERMYGTVGNSFVAVVEFGERLKAKAVVTGGQSGDPASPHFNDQAEMYRKGEFRYVLFYREDVEAAAEQQYQPGTEREARNQQ